MGDDSRRRRTPYQPKLVLRQCENEGLSLRAQRSNLCEGTASQRDCFVALLLAMTPQNHPDGLLGNRGWIVTRKRLFRNPLTSGVGEAAS